MQASATKLKTGWVPVIVRDDGSKQKLSCRIGLDRDAATLLAQGVVEQYKPARNH